jgi:hypothetical protein
MIPVDIPDGFGWPGIKTDRLARICIENPFPHSHTTIRPYDLHI